LLHIAKMPQYYLKRMNTEGGSVCVDVPDTTTIAEIKAIVAVRVRFRVCRLCGVVSVLVRGRRARSWLRRAVAAANP
jgi:hypothetical protein